MKRNSWRVASWVVLWVIFFVKGVWMLDPDLGWHIRMGETIVKSGIPLTDPFSYTMPSFPAVGNEWLNNVIEYFIFENWGKTGLAVVWAGLAVGAIAMAGGSAVPTLLAIGSLVGLGGVRAQVVDWMMLMLTLKIWQRWRWVIPALFGVWANLHGAFGLGPAVLGILIVVKIWQEKRVDWGDVGIWVAGVLATLVNPWGVRLWGEVWSQLADGGIKWTIGEWQPFWAVAPWVGVVMLAAGGGMLWWKYGRRETAGYALAAAILGIMAFGGIRHVGLFALMAIPVMAEGLKGLEWVAVAASGERWGKFYKLLLIVGLLVAGVEVGMGLVGTWKLRDGEFYPKEAVEWIKQNRGEGRLFTDYGWGGYVLWKMPGEKVFIDGRMATWKRAGAPENEENNAFEKFLAVTGGKEEAELAFEKYGVKMVLWPMRDLTERKPLLNLAWGKKIEKFLLTAELEKKGWLKVYGDKTAVIYIKL